MASCFAAFHFGNSYFEVLLIFFVNEATMWKKKITYSWRDSSFSSRCLKYCTCEQSGTLKWCVQQILKSFQVFRMSGGLKGEMASISGS